jgi:inorganic pyrophosphatase
LTEDGDAVDILALVEEPSFSGCLIEVRPIGVMNMIDQERRVTATLGWGGPDDARKVIRRVERYKAGEAAVWLTKHS